MRILRGVGYGRGQRTLGLTYYLCLDYQRCAAVLAVTLPPKHSLQSRSKGCLTLTRNALILFKMIVRWFDTSLFKTRIFTLFTNNREDTFNEQKIQDRLGAANRSGDGCSSTGIEPFNRACALEQAWGNVQDTKELISFTRFRFGYRLKNPQRIRGWESLIEPFSRACALEQARGGVHDTKALSSFTRFRLGYGLVCPLVLSIPTKNNQQHDSSKLIFIYSSFNLSVDWCVLL